MERDAKKQSESPSAVVERPGAGSHKMSQAPVKGEVFNHGQIVSMKMPEGWVEGESNLRSSIGTRSLRMFHPPDSPDSGLCLYYRGLKIDSAAGAAFSSLLKQPARELKGAELGAVADVLGGKSKAADFEISRVRTEDLNGKRVLTVEGRYKKSDNDVLHMYVDADGSGRVVQEIYFQAPKDDFSRHLKRARQAMKSIVWK